MHVWKIGLKIEDDDDDDDDDVLSIEITISLWSSLFDVHK